MDMKLTPLMPLLAVVVGCTEPEVAFSSSALQTVAPVVTTPVRHEYDGAPRSPNADDPAIWLPPYPWMSPLIIGVLKNAGLEVYHLDGSVVQVIQPSVEPCADDASGQTFGRYNNVDVTYGFALRRSDGAKRRVDLAVVTDRGCDRLRIYRIDPWRPEAPLVEITDPNAPRVFPTDALDEQSTAYGIALQRDDDDELAAFVTQRSRSVIAKLELVSSGHGHVTYQRVAELHAPAGFDGDLQFEGLVVDGDNERLYAAQELVGIWSIPLDDLEGTVTLSPDFLEEVVQSSGGEHVVADVEGMALYHRDDDDGYLLVSSQGDNTIHVYDRDGDEPLAQRHLGAFHVDGVEGTDGLDVLNVPMPGFAKGVLVVHDGEAPPPASTDPVDGFPYEASTRFAFVGWEDVAKLFQPRLRVSRWGWNPRD
jgi:3-phytase